jgi:hypothetical protein
MAEEISPLENHGWWMERLRKDAKANQPEALRLADALNCATDDDCGYCQPCVIAAELRRLHALNGELLDALTHVSDWFTAAGIDVPAIQHARAAIAKAEGKV